MIARYLFLITNVPPAAGVVRVIVAPALVIVLGRGLCNDLIHQADELHEDVVMEADDSSDGEQGEDIVGDSTHVGWG